ncbi:YwiC-like family protein [Phocicoccus schoeneichii]
MKFKKQNQHGAWAMVFMPPIIGILANGFNISQVLFIIGWLLIFFSADQVLFFIKTLRRKQYGYIKSAILFASIAAILFIYPLIVDYRIIYFFLLMIPFGFINAYFSKKKDERNILNDVSAIIIFSMAGATVSFLNAHEINFGVLFAFVVSFLYFMGVTFVVKTVIRE